MVTFCKLLCLLLIGILSQGNTVRTNEKSSFDQLPTRLNRAKLLDLSFRTSQGQQYLSTGRSLFGDIVIGNSLSSSLKSYNRSSLSGSQASVSPGLRSAESTALSSLAVAENPSSASRKFWTRFSSLLTNGSLLSSDEAVEFSTAFWIHLPFGNRSSSNEYIEVFRMGNYPSCGFAYKVRVLSYTIQENVADLMAVSWLQISMTVSRTQTNSTEVFVSK